MNPNLNEELWRTFQSKFARLLNDLPRKEQKKYFYVFGMREEFESNFNFEQMREVFLKNVREKKSEKKRTKYLRKLIADIEVQKQKDILESTTNTITKNIFNLKDEIATRPNVVVQVAKEKASKKSRGCEFFPCGDGK